jgi:hypothetical protein
LDLVAGSAFLKNDAMFKGFKMKEYNWFEIGSDS